jgi:hypothetical protein
MDMPTLGRIDFIWLLLMVLTLANALIAESADPSFFFVVVIAISVAIKGRLVVDRFMELTTANRLIRKLMVAYFYVIPSLIILVHAFPDLLAELTKLN